MRLALTLSTILVFGACSQGASDRLLKQVENASQVQTSDIASIKNGTEGVGGGDLCEDRIKIIRDDIKSWIHSGGHKNLELPTSMSAEQYATGMLEQIETTTASCVSRGDAEYPVQVNATPKICKYTRTTNASKITCDLEKFTSLTESNQYILIHHELAGLANLETPNGDDSDYSISNQISGFLESQIIKKLAVGPKPSDNPFDENSCTGPQLDAEGLLAVLGNESSLSVLYKAYVRSRNVIGKQYGPWKTELKSKINHHPMGVGLIRVENSGFLTSLYPLSNIATCSVLDAICYKDLGRQLPSPVVKSFKLTKKCLRILINHSLDNRQYEEVILGHF